MNIKGYRKLIAWQKSDELARPRKTGKEKRRFYEIALSSLTELEYYIDFCYQIRLISESSYRSLVEKQTESAKILVGLERSTR